MTLTNAIFSLLRIELSYFRQFKNVEIFLPQKGLLGVVGLNGAGKSTLFNAISWALYGKYDGVKQALLKTQGASPRSKTYVVVDFIFQGDFYRIRRDLVSSSSRNYVLRNGETMASGTSEMSSYIEETLFKMDFKTFTTCYYAMQDDFDALAKLTDSKRVTMISKLLRIESIDVAADQARKDKRVLETELEEAKRHLHNEQELSTKRQDLKIQEENLKSKIKDLELILNDLIEKRESLEKEKTKSDKLFDQYQNITNTISNLETKRQTLSEHSLKQSQDHLSMLINKQNRLNDIVHKKERYIHLLQQKDDMNEKKEQFVAIERLKKDCNNHQKNIAFYDEQIIKSNELIGSFEVVEVNLQAKESEVANKESALGKLREQVQELQTLLRVKKDEYQNNQNEIESFTSLKSDVPCPTCARPLSEDGHYEKHLENLYEIRNQVLNSTSGMKEEYQSLVEKGTNAKNSISLLKEEVRSLQQQLSEKSGYIATKENSLYEKKKQEELLSSSKLELSHYPENLAFDPSLYKELIDELNATQPYYEEILSLEQQVKEIPNLEDSITDLKSDILKLSEEVNTFSSERDALNFNKEKHIELQQSIESSRTLSDTKKDELFTLKTSLQNVHAELTSIKQRLEENIQKKAAQKEKLEEIQLLSKLDELYKAYKNDKLSKLAPALSDMMSEMMDELTSGKYDRVELDTKYNIHIYRDGEKQPLEIFSGGEKKLASLCQRIAISQLLASQTGQASLDMIALDEVFGAMDAQRQDSMIEMFRNLNNMFSQILIVSHNDFVKEMFDHTLEISLDKNSMTSSAKWLTNEMGNPTWDESEMRDLIQANYADEEA